MLQKWKRRSEGKCIEKEVEERLGKKKKHHQSWKVEILRGVLDPVWTQWTITSPKKKRGKTN